MPSINVEPSCEKSFNPLSGVHTEQENTVIVSGFMTLKKSSEIINEKVPFLKQKWKKNLQDTDAIFGQNARRDRLPFLRILYGCKLFSEIYLEDMTFWGRPNQPKK